VPAKPIEVSSSSDSKTYRYNLQGDPIKESFLSDIEAVNSGYISLSILDYDLTKNDEDNNFIKNICQ
jgi:broad specificity polyphosphatase/5'/3'-nucleotidase SurE